MSSSNSSITPINRSSYPNEGPFCHCRNRTSLTKAWTDDNPGRYYYNCKSHGFFKWADKEPPYGWQKRSLLDARDEIRLLRSHINHLEGTITNHLNFTNQTDEPCLINTVSHQETSGPIRCDQPDKLLRQFIIMSWCFFVLVIAVIVTILKE